MTARTTVLAGLTAVALSVTPAVASNAYAVDDDPAAVAAVTVPAGSTVPDTVTAPQVGGPVEAAAFWTILCDMFGGNCG